VTKKGSVKRKEIKSRTLTPVYASSYHSKNKIEKCHPLHQDIEVMKQLQLLSVMVS
jgi:hypothetical protein